MKKYDGEHWGKIGRSERNNRSDHHIDGHEKIHWIDEDGERIRNVILMIVQTPERLQPTTHIVLGFLVGAGFNQQPQTFRFTVHSGQNQRRASALRVGFAAIQSSATAADLKMTAQSAPQEHTTSAIAQKATHFKSDDVVE